MSTLSPDLGAAAWVIEDLLCGCTMQGATQTLGPSQEVDSYQLELQGIHILLLALLVVCSSFFKIVNEAITVGCDSSASLNHSSADWIKVSQHLQHVNLVQAIQHLCHHLPICILFQHVGGLQDQNTSYELL